MCLSPDLLTLARFLVGEFENREQAIADPAWYVHLHLWHRPTPLFQGDSITLFAEQANAYTLHQPYRQRLLRLQASPEPGGELWVQYYALNDPTQFRGAGQNPQCLEHLTIDDVHELPGCRLSVQIERSSPGCDRFIAQPRPDSPCYFQYQGQTRQVILGFEIGSHPDHPEVLELLTYDRGVDPDTGQGLWGALMGPFRFRKRSG